MKQQSPCQACECLPSRLQSQLQRKLCPLTVGHVLLCCSRTGARVLPRTGLPGGVCNLFSQRCESNFFLNWCHESHDECLYLRCTSAQIFSELVRLPYHPLMKWGSPKWNYKIWNWFTRVFHSSGK